MRKRTDSRYRNYKDNQRARSLSLLALMVSLVLIFSQFSLTKAVGSEDLETTQTTSSDTATSIQDASEDTTTEDTTSGLTGDIASNTASTTDSEGSESEAASGSSNSSSDTNASAGTASVTSGVETSTAGTDSSETTSAQNSVSVETATTEVTDSSANSSSTGESSQNQALAVVEEALGEEFVSAKITAEDVFELSDQQVLTAEVIEALDGTLDPDSADSVSLDNFTFTTNDEEPLNSDAIEEQAVADEENLTNNSVPVGSIEGLFNNTITVDSKNYFLSDITVGGMTIYHIGNLQIAGETYVYYVTDETQSDATVYTVLNPEAQSTASNVITVAYLRGDVYTIDYEIRQNGSTSTSDTIGGYDLEDVFGSDRSTYIEVPFTEGGQTNSGSYTVNAQIPRSYTATISVYNLNDDGSTTGAAVATETLGDMLSYSTDVSNGLVQLAEGSPSSVQLSKSFTVSGVNANQKVVITYEQKTSFTFSAMEWFQTTNTNAGYGVQYIVNQPATHDYRTHSAAITVTNSAGDEQSNVSDSTGDSDNLSVSFSEGDTIVLEFTSQSTGSSTNGSNVGWRVNLLQFNGEYVLIPYLAEQASEPVSVSTTLSTGTVVEVTAEDLNPDWTFAQATDTQYNSRKETKYTITITNCQEDLTLSGGNVAAFGHQEVGFETISGIANLSALQNSGSWYSGINGTGFTTGEIHALANTTEYSVSSVVYRFTHVPGYFLPNVTVNDRDGDAISNAIQWLKLKDGYYVEEDESSADYGKIKDSSGSVVGGTGSDAASTIISTAFEVVSDPSSLTPNVGEYYFFKFTDEVASNISTHVKLYLSLNGQLADLEVHYDDGASENASDSAPAASAIENLPGTDTNSGEYYDVENNYIVAVSSAIPVDTSGQFVFAGWQVVAVGEGWSSDVVTVDGEPVVLDAGAHLDLSEELAKWEQGAITYPSATGENDQVAYFTFRALWESADNASVVNYEVSYAVDGQEIQSDTYRVNRGAKLVFQAFDANTGNYTTALQEIIDAYVSEWNSSQGALSSSNVFLDNVTVTSFVGSADGTGSEITEVFSGRSLLNGGVLVNGEEGLDEYTQITVNFGTGVAINYEFENSGGETGEGGDAAANLPDGVLDQLEQALVEADAPLYASFSEIDASSGSATAVNGLYDYSFSDVDADTDNGRGTWSFVSWDKDSATYDRSTDSITFTGSWRFDTYHVYYVFVSSNSGIDLPQAILDAVPVDAIDYANGVNVSAVASTVLPFTTYYDEALGGTWTFQSWQEGDAQTISGQDVTFTGVWMFTFNPDSSNGGGTGGGASSTTGGTGTGTGDGTGADGSNSGNRGSLAHTGATAGVIVVALVLIGLGSLFMAHKSRRDAENAA